MDSAGLRNCDLVADGSGNGYGFELHRLSNKAGHFVGVVDPDSPAERGGLKKGDEIVEVQGTNVRTMAHGLVASEIAKHDQNLSLVVYNSAGPDEGTSTTRSIENRSAVITQGKTKSDNELLTIC